MTRKEYFLIGHYDNGTNHTPVHLDPKTMPEAQASVRWQNQGDVWAGAIYTPITGKPGVMRLVSAYRSALDDHPSEVTLSHMGWTETAWADFLARTWGA